MRSMVEGAPGLGAARVESNAAHPPGPLHPSPAANGPPPRPGEDRLTPIRLKSLASESALA
jgi:hypothetical protein